MPNTFENKEIASAAGKKSSNKGQKQQKTILREKLGLKNLEDLKPQVLKILQKGIKNTDKLNTGMPIDLVVAKDIAKIITPKEIKGDFTMNIKVEKFF